MEECCKIGNFLEEVKIDEKLLEILLANPRKKIANFKLKFCTVSV